MRRIRASRALTPVLHEGEDALVAVGTVPVGGFRAAIAIVKARLHFDSNILIADVVKHSRISRILVPRVPVRVAEQLSSSRVQNIGRTGIRSEVVATTLLPRLALGAGGDFER